MHSGQHPLRNHIAHDFNRIVLDNTQIAQTIFLHPFEQRTHPCCKHFNPNVVDIGVLRSDFRRCLTHTTADLQNDGVIVAKYLRPLLRAFQLFVIGNAKHGHEAFVSATLRF